MQTEKRYEKWKMVKIGDNGNDGDDNVLSLYLIRAIISS